MPSRLIDDQKLKQIVSEVISNARHREEIYLPRSLPLNAAQKEAMHPFFSGTLLNQVRILELTRERIPNPAYQERAQKRGYRLMLDFPHKSVIAHPRLIILQEKLSLRHLFHGLVHVAQYAVLGLEQYLELYVRAFIKTGNYTSVPLEVQAFQLDHRYTEDPSRPFPVEDEVRQWNEEDSYAIHPSVKKIV